MEFITLNNGLQIPILGFGVFQIAPDICEQCVVDAIAVGYRRIDTAQSYQNEEAVGKAIERCGINRNELFITTKVWIDQYGYEQTLKSVEASMKRLCVDYLDTVLLHQPFGDYYGAYRALVHLYNDGKIRSIGVSNFYPDRLSDLCLFQDVIPQINQVEVNPFHQQIAAIQNMNQFHVQMEAWAPFAEGRNDMFHNEVLVRISNKYNKSVAQVIIRWLIQRDIVVLSKTVHKDRMLENLSVFDFCLSQDDMNLIASLDKKESSFFHHQTPETVAFFAKLVTNRKR